MMRRPGCSVAGGDNPVTVRVCRVLCPNPDFEMEEADACQVCVCVGYEKVFVRGRTGRVYDQSIIHVAKGRHPLSEAQHSLRAGARATGGFLA